MEGAVDWKLRHDAVSMENQAVRLENSALREQFVALQQTLVNALSLLRMYEALTNGRTNDSRRSSEVVTGQTENDLCNGGGEADTAHEDRRVTLQSEGARSLDESS